MRAFQIILLVMLSGLIMSCAEEEPVPEIDMPSTPIMSGTVSWGVVNVSYLKINRDPDDDQHIITTLRQGDLVRIDSIRFIKVKGGIRVWYQIEKDGFRGWVEERFLDGYPTREKAETASLFLTAD